MPPPKPASFPVILLRVTVIVFVPKAAMPPPFGALFPLITLRVTVTLGAADANRPPPAPGAVLSVSRVRERVREFSLPPALSAPPLS